MNGLATARLNVTRFPGRFVDGHGMSGLSGMAGLSGLADVYYNPQDQSWYEIRDGVPVRVSGTPPRTPSGSTSGPYVPLPANTPSGWAAFATALTNVVGGGLVGYLQQKQALDVAKFQYQANGGVVNGSNAASGGGFTGLVAQVTNFASQNPLLVAAGVAGVFLLMMNPPSKRR